MGILFLIILIVVLFGGGNNQDQTLGDALAYVHVVENAANDYGIPPELGVALIAWESGGNWLASNTNVDGSVDAGLCQINDVNWPAYGLTEDPYNISNNINAGMAILGQAFKKYKNKEDALYAYNAGSPDNGRKYNPTYAPNVLDRESYIMHNDLVASVHSYDSNDLILTAAEGEFTFEAKDDGVGSNRIRKDTINPPSIDVQITDDKKNKILDKATAIATTGKYYGFPQEATIYVVHTSSPLKKGMVVNVTNKSYESGVNYDFTITLK